MADEFGLWHPGSHNPAGLTEEEMAAVAECLSYWMNVWKDHEVPVLSRKAELLKSSSLKIGTKLVEH